MTANPTAESGAKYRDASEAIHRDNTVLQRNYANLVMLGACGYNSLIRDDFYGMFGFAGGEAGNLLDAGCGTSVDLINLRKIAPGMAFYGVDVSSVALAQGRARPGGQEFIVHQAALESIPFVDRSFDVISAHEVIEHVENPAAVLSEFFRVLKPGGMCVIATPNGTSLWPEHLRQRVARLFGRRGAPVGADHTRTPSYWRREFTRAGFTVERQIFDAAAIEFQTYVAPAVWMPKLSRMLEPLRAVPLLRLMICDRVKFRLRRPAGAEASRAAAAGAAVTCCTVCRAPVVVDDDGAACRSGHRFSRGAAGSIDFTEPVRTRGVVASAAPQPQQLQPRWAFQVERWLRRSAIALYVCLVLPLAPLGWIASRYRQPFDAVAPDKWTV